MTPSDRSVRATIDRFATDRVILCLGWLVFLVYAYPGFMSYDSVYQLIQARHIDPVNEWHPPLMAFIWRITDNVIRGPFPMLVLQSVTFLLGLWSILGRVMSSRAAAITAVVVMLLPQNLPVMAVIWKDSQMAGFLLAGIALLLSDCRRRKIAGCVFLFLATGVRYNAAAPTFPILLLLWGRQDRPWLKRYAIASALWLGITIASFVINGALVEKKTYPWHSSVALLDIAGTLRYAPKLDNDQLLRDSVGVPWLHTDQLSSRARKGYQPMNTFIDLTEGPFAMFVPPTTDAERSAIASLWKQLVFEQPAAFLRHRISVFGKLLHPDAEVWYGFVNAEWGAKLLEHQASYSPLQLAWAEAMQVLYDTPLVQPGIYFVLALALLPLARRQKHALVLLTSAVAHMLGLFVLSPAVDYRYSHWMILCTIVAGIILFVTRLRGKEASA